LNYIDLILSFILFAMGILVVVRKRLRSNRWIIVLAILFFPIALVSYYFPHLDIVLFGETTVLKMIIYPFIKIVILLALARSLWNYRKSRPL
jgi:heme/copper-type cytochrome/quinol oxidase subunit 4